jgi:aromatic ring-cleaving dioxygenase
MNSQVKFSIIDLHDFTAEEKMTRVGGERLRKLILTKKKPIKIEFHGKAIASVSFLDEGLAKLVQEGWTKKQIQEELTLHQIHSRDLKLLEDLIRSHLV